MENTELKIDIVSWIKWLVESNEILDGYHIDELLGKKIPQSKWLKTSIEMFEYINIVLEKMEIELTPLLKLEIKTVLPPHQIDEFEKMFTITPPEIELFKGSIEEFICQDDIYSLSYSMQFGKRTYLVHDIDDGESFWWIYITNDKRIEN